MFHIFEQPDKVNFSRFASEPGLRYGTSLSVSNELGSSRYTLKRLEVCEYGAQADIRILLAHLSDKVG